MDAKGHGEVVLSYILGGGGDLHALDLASARLDDPEYFTDRTQRALFGFLQLYAHEHGGICTRKALSDILRDKRPGSAQRMAEFYDALTAGRPEEHEFKHSVHQLRELSARRMTGDALQQGMAILNPRPGEEILDEQTKEPLAGHKDARQYVLEVFARAERASGAMTPEGDVTSEGESVLAEYARAKELRAAGHLPGIRFGLPALDDYLTGGLLPAEMAIIVAATTAGKSSFCVQVGWYNAVMEGLNVVFFTTEQHRSALRRKLVARHSMHPKFGLRDGIDDSLIRSGRLSEHQEKALDWVLDDLKTGGYGQLNVVQLPEVATISGMAARYAAIRRQYKVHLCIADYLQLFTPETRRRESRVHEDQAGLVKSAAGWCRSVDDGEGVPFITPWQVNGDGAASMRSSGRISLEQHMSESKEAGKTPGVVLGLLNPEDDHSGGRCAPLDLHVMKNRAGKRGASFPVDADYATSCFTDRGQGGGELFGGADLDI
jgi:DnaB-like helicase C terminal domain